MGVSTTSIADFCRADPVFMHDLHDSTVTSASEPAAARQPMANSIRVH